MSNTDDIRERAREQVYASDFMRRPSRRAGGRVYIARVVHIVS